jgi:hypothetical protein
MINATWKLWAYLNGAWSDITDDVKRNTDAEWGMGGNEPIDFVAHPGTFEFNLDNYTVPGKYSPDHPSALSGWKKGVPIKQVFTYEGEDYIRFRGFVGSFSNQGEKDEFKHVVVVDWLEYASKHPIVNPGILQNQRPSNTLETTLSLMAIKPQEKDFEIGVNLFVTTFDTVTSKTRAYDEAVKIALSEIAPVYLRKNKSTGETLVLESAGSRNAQRTLTPIPLAASDSGFLLKEDGGYLLKEDGGKIILNQSGTLHLDDNTSILDYETEDGENVLNRFTIYALPRRIDASPVILFQLDAPLAIGSGQSIHLTGNYADPNSGMPINAKDMITPVATTDYEVWTEDDGSGTDLTADLDVVTSYGAEGFDHVLTNNNGNTGWITMFNCRGYGIYIYNPVEHSATDQDSIDEFETHAESITQKYKNGLVFGSFYVDTVVDDEKQPRTVLNKTFMTANKSASMMMAFLNLDVGDLIRITEERTNIDKYYYIQEVIYQTRPAGIIFFEWIVKETLTMALGLNRTAVEFAGGASGDGIDFGYLPHTNRLPRRSYSVWIYADAAPVGTSDVIMAPFSDEAGVAIFLTTDRRIQYYSKNTVNLGAWMTPVNSVPLTAWTHILVTMDIGDGSTNDPVIYINGVAQSLTETSTPSGALKLNNEPGVNFVIGNWKTSTEDYSRAFDGKIQDPRVYNRIVNQAEATALTNGGTPDPTLLIDENLVFQGFCVRTDRLSQYTNQSLTSDLKVRDTIMNILGTPHGAPVGRTP